MNGPVIPNTHRKPGIARWQFWLVLTVVVTAGVQFSIASAFGDPAALLHAGKDYPASEFLQEELGEVPLFPSVGHDGQAFYVIARQPFGGDAAALLDDPALRYRRWLFPALGGLFGTLPPTAAVLGLAVLSAAGMALAVVSVLQLAQHDGSNRWWPVLAVLLNPGLWWAVSLSTADAMGVGLALAALAAYRAERWGLTAGLLTAAVMTKEQFLVVALALALAAFRAGHSRRAVALTAPPIAALGLLTAFFTARFGGPGTVGENLSLPFLGLVAGVTKWPEFDRFNVALAVFALTVVIAAAALAWSIRDRPLRYLLIGWTAMALISGEVIWILGNNVSRVLAMLPPLVALALVEVGKASGVTDRHRR